MENIDVEELLKTKREELEFLPGNWYIARTRSMVENNVRDEILRRVKNNNGENLVYEVLAPMVTKVTQRQGQKIERESVRVPAYILVRMEDDDDAFEIVTGTNDVTGLLGQLKAGKDARPISISTDEVWDMLEESLREQLTPESEKEIIEQKENGKDEVFAKDDLVTIIDGPFENMEAKVEEVDEKSRRVHLSVSIFGRDTPVELGYNQITH